MYRYIYFIDFIIYSFIYSITLPMLCLFCHVIYLFIYSYTYLFYLFTLFLYLFISFFVYLLYLHFWLYVCMCIYIYMLLTVTKASFAPNIRPERRFVGRLLNNELGRMGKEII